MHTTTIGEVARRASLSTETIRYYERQGLIPKPARSANGYRDYPPDTVARLAFIKRAKMLGFSLKEIHDLLQVREDDTANAGDIKQRALSKLREIETEIDQLQQIHLALGELISACPGHGLKEICPILSALNEN